MMFSSPENHMDFLLGLAMGMAVSYLITRLIIWATMRQIEREGIEVDQLIQRMKEKVQDSIVQARLEEHQGMFYLYRVDNSEFIAQGRTHDEIRKITDQRLPNLPVYVTEAEDAVLERYHATKNPA